MLGWCTAGYGAGITHPFYYLGMGAAYGHLTWQIITAELDNPTNLAERFRSNQLLGGIVFCSIVAGNVSMGM
jgi:4-hydroxybenzoate polyprenyltransferase